MPPGPDDTLHDRALHATANGVVVADVREPGTPVVYANAAFRRLLPDSEEDVVGRPWSDALPDVPVATDATWQGTRVVGRAGGATFHSDITVSPLGPDAAATHVVAVLTDVTHHVDTADRLAAAEVRYGRVIDDLATAELRYRELVEQIPAVVYIADFDADATLRYVSPQIAELLGPPPVAFTTDQGLWYRHVHPADLARVRAEEHRTFAAQVGFDLEYRMLRSDGRIVWVWERDTIVRTPDGRPLFTQGVIVDITAQRRAEEELRAERDRAQRYLDLAGSAIVVIDRDERIALLNRAGHDLLGYEEGALIGRNWFDTCLPEPDRELTRGEFRRLLGGGGDGEPTHENAVLTAGGDERIVRWNNTVLHDDDGKPSATLSSGLDVTERRRAEAQIAYLAYHDSLTGLPNRALLREHLELAMARARRTGHAVALLYLDLDDFKLVNDTLGHPAGDELLRRIALGLRARTRDSDLLARQGGDEFLLLLADLDSDGAEDAASAAATSALSALDEPFEISGATFHVGASIGISIFPRDADDADALLKHADTAMYEAKAAGHNQLRVYRDRTTPSVDRLSLTTRIRKAIARDELTLHWQPIQRLTDGTVAALEALVRWDDPEHGLVLPVDFIPYAEDTGLIENIGEWVVDAFSAQRRLWHADGLDPFVGFNLSPRELRRDDFLKRLLTGLTVDGLGLDRVTVELTESAVLREDVRMYSLVHGLAEAGVGVALDDFGVAYTSLARLRDVPARWIKIDRSFLEGVPADPQRTKVFNAVLDLISAIGLECIVEGVETERQREFVAGRACVLAQGYALGRPAPAAELESRLRESPECSIAPT